MKLKVIAEYVENREILDLLKDMGVEYGQGYHIARPGPLEDVLREHMR
jgi:EAL domain-containing protein (putative c-di-GMP-specific phosphodiesterase class I)